MALLYSIFETPNWAKQDDPLSASLFSLEIDTIMKQMDLGEGYVLSWFVV